MTFDRVILCMLRLLRLSLQRELYQFFAALGECALKVTPSAFIQNRKKIKADLFYDLNHHIVNEFFTDNAENVKLFKGLRVLSIDGSTIHLPFSKQLAQHYGTYKSDDLILGRVSVMYDVLNDILIDGLLRPSSEGEVSVGKEHLKFAGKGDLIIMDRLYPSFNWIYLLQQQQVEFLFRCKEGFSNEVKAFVASGKEDAFIQIKPGQSQSFKNLPYDKNHTITVRMLRIRLDSGELEILMTSLDQIKFPYSDFKELYFKRWTVETFYDRFKNIISVECFSGKSHQFIQQEFNCALCMSNFQTLLTQSANKEAAKKYQKRKYEYKVNQSVGLGIIRERFLQIFSNKGNLNQQLKEIKQLFIENVIPIRPGRKNKRKPHKYHNRIKPKQFTNRRIVI